MQHSILSIHDNGERCNSDGDELKAFEFTVGKIEELLEGTDFLS